MENLYIPLTNECSLTSTNILKEFLEVPNTLHIARWRSLVTKRVICVP